MQVRRTTAITATALSFALLTSCTSHGATPAAVTSAGVPTTTSATDSVSPSPSATPTPTATTPPPPVTIKSLSGLAGTAGKPAVAVKIENTRGGRPQFALNDADIVYVEQVEGGLTRLMAVFQSKLPTKVGAVR